ncbi:MAG: nodulation protein NfeD [Dehalococcoidia bacterium]|nr:nodulation protein NfeD [Dehalococcoidia bacterium]
MRAAWVVAILSGLLLWALIDTRVAADGHASNEVFVVELDGTITLVTERFISRALDEAEDDGAELVVIRIDTPGGTLDATRDIVTRLLAAEVPVVSYVAPDGARAASAGTFVTAAAGLAAMAPTTNIGAAAVITGEGEDLPETLGKKVTEDTAALIRSIAELRGRNSDALEATIRDALAYTASEAVELGVVDLIAVDLPDLLAQLDGREISTASGSLRVSTSDLTVRELRQSFVERFLGFLADPNIAFLLLSLGGLGLVVEIWSPGLGIPGALGVGFLILAYASFGVLPFSWAGVALIALAVALIAGEMHAPGGGILGVAGVIALILGGLFLFDSGGGVDVFDPSVKVSLWLLAVVGAAAGALVGWLAWEMRRSASELAYVSGTSHEALIGQAAVVTRALDPSGEVLVAGEHWQANVTEGVVVDSGASVVIRTVDGLRLGVEPRDEPIPDDQA